MEDCLVFDELMTQYGDRNVAKVLAAFSEFRQVDAHAVADLAMYNYVEVSHSTSIAIQLVKQYIECFVID